MPRLPNALLRRARALSPHLPLLLRACRDLRSARNELRWLGEYVDSVTKKEGGRDGRAKGREREREREERLRGLVRERARGAPLQYLVGSEWFGELEIGCRRGVLIPRFVGVCFAFV